MRRQSIDLAGRQGWDVAMDGDVSVGPKRQAEPAEPIDGARQRRVLAASEAEAELLGEIHHVDLETVGLLVELGCNPTQQQHGARSEDRHPELFHVGAAGIVAQLGDDRIIEGTDSE
jgi:hypothetical protein